jgi:hypothetical protein
MKCSSPAARAWGRTTINVNLSDADAAAMIPGLDEPEALAVALVERFSPKWLLG